MTLSHDFDWWTGLFGDLTVLSVHHSTGDLDLDIPTSYDIVLDNVDSSVQVNMHLDYEGSERYYLVEYENGILRYNPLLATLTWNDEEVLLEHNTYSTERKQSFVNTFVNFIDDIGTPPYLTDWELGLTALEVADTVENWK